MDDIIVKKLDNNHYEVHQGNKYSDQLGYDEMLGLFVALSMPNNRPCLQWMRTKEQHKQKQDYFESLKNKNINEGLLKIDNSDET
jgi:hypothetical protein